MKKEYTFLFFFRFIYLHILVLYLHVCLHDRGEHQMPLQMAVSYHGIGCWELN